MPENQTPQVKAIFFRLLTSPIDGKGDDLRCQVASLNQGELTPWIYAMDPSHFSVIPGSVFPYWISNKLLGLFSPNLDEFKFYARQGLITANDFRFLRLWWEVGSNQVTAPKNLLIEKQQSRWYPFAKGGNYSPYYSDLHLVVDWENDGENIKGYYDPISEKQLSRPQNLGYYFRPGLTWSLRSQKGITFRPLPSGCIFSHKGPSIFNAIDDKKKLLSLLPILNSSPYITLIETRMAFGSYEVGVIQQTPIPADWEDHLGDLAHLALQAFEFIRLPNLSDETTHVFILPTIILVKNSPSVSILPSLDATLLTTEPPAVAIATTIAEAAERTTEIKTWRQANLATLQHQIDNLVADLYGVPEHTSDDGMVDNDNDEERQEDQDEEGEEGEDGKCEEVTAQLVRELLSWCVGVVFGRWDARLALDPSQLPPLPSPFDPLPVCSPGMLQRPDGLPLDPQDIPSDYPVRVARDGFLVDDPCHPQDIVAAIESVLRLLWGERTDALLAEACQILGVPDLRAWLRDPKGFFDFHIKRYSKSRRKAPIYWLLQSAKRGYGIWLYYPRLNPDTLFHAARQYGDAKLQLEQDRLEEVKSGLSGLAGTQRKEREKQIAHQADLVEEIKAFQKKLNEIALMQFKPDLNDGVLLNIAPVSPIVPWKEAEKAWKELLAGKYAWSSIAQQLHKKES